MFLYNGDKTIQLNDPGIKSLSPKIDGDNVVWTGIDSEGNSEIFFYNGKETIQITDNNVYDYNPQISGSNIVWIGGDNGDEIFFYNGRETIQLTNNNELYKVSPRLERNPIIDGNRVVWQRFNLSDSTTKVMLATIDGTKSSSIPSGDRPTQIITASTIAIFCLIFVYLSQKLIRLRR